MMKLVTSMLLFATLALAACNRNGQSASAQTLGARDAPSMLAPSPFAADAGVNRLLVPLTDAGASRLQLPLRMPDAGLIR